jgi:hypothetical protein
VALCLLLASSASATLIANGSFGTGDFTDWTVTGYDAPCPDDVYCGVFSGSEFPLPIPGGDTYAAYFSGIDSDTYLSQTLSLAPSTSYTLSLSLDEFISPIPPTYPNFFGIYFDGTVGNQDGTALVTETNVPDSGGVYNTLTYTFSTAASGNSNLLQFAFINDTGYFLIDNISVVPASSIAPEPASFGLFLIGLACVVARSFGKVTETRP